MIDQNYMKALIVILFCFHHTFAQQNEQYQILVSKASLSHLQKDVEGAIAQYEQAFAIQAPDALSAYKAAGAYSLNHDARKALKFLEIALAGGWTEADWLASDPYFDYLKRTDTVEWNV